MISTIRNIEIYDLTGSKLNEKDESINNYFTELLSPIVIVPNEKEIYFYNIKNKKIYLIFDIISRTFMIRSGGFLDEFQNKFLIDNADCNTLIIYFFEKICSIKIIEENIRILNYMYNEKCQRFLIKNIKNISTISSYKFNEIRNTL